MAHKRLFVRAEYAGSSSVSTWLANQKSSCQTRGINGVIAENENIVYIDLDGDGNDLDDQRSDLMSDCTNWDQISYAESPSVFAHITTLEGS